MVIAGAMSHGDVPALCEQVTRLLEGAGADGVICDVRGIHHADAAAIDGLARLQLAAMRRGRRIWLHRPSDDLSHLIALCGLSEALPSAD